MTGRRPRLALAVAAALLTACAGCGLDVEEPDLFLLTRTGPGPTLTLLINDSGTIACDGAKTKPISSPLLIQARDLADDLTPDATRKLTLAAAPGSVFRYRIRMQQGTITFSDRNARGHKELAEAELFAAQAAQQACGLSG